MGRGRWMDGRKDGWMDGWGGRMDGRTAGQMGTRTGGWMDGWTSGWTECTHGPGDFGWFSAGTILRNKIAQEYALVVRTTPQLIVEIAMHRQRMQTKYSPENLAAEFNAKIRAAEGTDKDEITASLVDQAITAWNRCLSTSENMDIVMANVNKYGHGTVFQGVGLFQSIVSKGQSSPNIKWLVQDLDDQFRNNVIPGKGISHRDMTGTKQKPSWPQKSLFRMNILKYLREDWLEVQPCDAQFKAMIREITEKHALWRKFFGWQDEVCKGTKITTPNSKCCESMHQCPVCCPFCCSAVLL